MTPDDRPPPAGPVSTTTIAEMGALIGDPGRASMLTGLLDGRALTARELADLAGVSPQTASSHLGKLIAAGLIRMEKHGRHHYHQLASAEVAHMLESMHVAGAHRAPAPRRAAGAHDKAIQAARSCYDHLAGKLAVELADALQARGFIRLDLSGGALTDSGADFLSGWGIDLAGARRGKRAFCRACLDWSERRPHLAGAVGAAILDRSLALDWVRRRQGTRALAVTPAGQLGFARTFAVAV
jgi:DNA-binding transcriptional ArsR family regulator